jgi:general nucleoside transport system permease protein
LVTSLIQIMLSIFIVFLFSSIVLLLVGTPPITAFYHIFKGALGSWIKFSYVVSVWIPLTLCACGLLFTFRINLWNIGVEGQIIIGAVSTIATLRIGLGFHPSWITLVFSFVAGSLGGAVWAMAAGFLKTKVGINEIFSGLGLNFLAQGLILYLIFGPWKRPGTASMSGTELLPDDLWLPVFNSFRISSPGILIVTTSLALTFFILRYSRMGLALKAIGNNYTAAVFYGLKPNQYMLAAMFFAGGFAGIAGSIQVTAVYHRLIPAISSNYGYLALLVVMLANYRVWPTPFIAFFFACLNVGSIQLPMKLQLDSSLSGVIQGAFVLAMFVMHAWKIKIQRKNKSLYC